MAFSKLEDTNALLLYRVGPVLMCSPTLQVESVIVPPAISRASATSDAEPGMFKSMYGMVRVVDLRVRFGVDASLHKQPGQIIIVEVTGGHAGFWVDEIEDVIAYPQTGWSQAPSHVPGSVFSRALIQTDDIRLYADFDRLDGFKTSGYLREHIRRLQQAATQETAPTDNRDSPAKTQSVQSQSSVLRHVAAAMPVDAPAETDAHPASSTDKANTPIEGSKNPPVNSSVKPDNDSFAKRNIDSQPATVNQKPTSGQELSHTSTHQSRVNECAQTLQKTDRHADHQPAAKHAQRKHDRVAVSGPDSGESIVSSINQAGSADSNDMQTQVAPTAVESEKAGTGWIWWFVSLLLLFIVLFMLMQNSRLLQTLTGQDEAVDLQDRVDLQKDTVAFQAEITLDSDVVDSSASTSDEASAEIKPSMQMADDLTDVAYIEPESGDLVITVNDYEVDSAFENELSVEVSAQNQVTTQVKTDSEEKLLQKIPSQQSAAEDKQSLPENKIVDAKFVQTEIKQQIASPQNAKQEAEKILSDKVEVVDKTAAQMSRRLQHIVVKGDTLWSITGRYINKPWRYPEVARLSNIDNPHLIYPGQRVIIVLNYKNRSE